MTQTIKMNTLLQIYQDDVIKWKYFPLDWPFVRGILTYFYRFSYHLTQNIKMNTLLQVYHDDVIKLKHFPRHWPFVRGIHMWPAISPHKGQWHRALMFSLIRALMSGWVNNREYGDLRRQHAHYDVTVMTSTLCRFGLVIICTTGSIGTHVTVTSFPSKCKSHIPGLMGSTGPP